VTYTVKTGEDYSEEKNYIVRLRDGTAGIDISAYPLHLSAPDRSVFESFTLALRESWIMTVQTVKGIGQLFLSLAVRGTVPEGITGIVGIAQLTHVSVQQGFMTYLRLVALLSLSLAILNILPFPALDGGRLLFVVAEGISRRPVNRRFELATNAAGFMFLILLIVLITFYDILRLITS
jgi:regulator of sigma E protease